MSKKFIAIDFEYNHSKDKEMNVVCACAQEINGSMVTSHKWWLEAAHMSSQWWATCDKEGWDLPTKESQIKNFLDKIEKWREEGYVFIAHAVLAEARSLHSLGYDPRKLTWIDTSLEYRMLINHHKDFSYGKHLMRNGDIRNVRKPKPKWMQNDSDKEKGGRAEASLAGATYKMLGIDLDTKHKRDMRDLIIAGGPFSDDDRTNILNYCMSDVENLHKLAGKIMKANRKALKPEDASKLISEAHLRGDYAARSAVMETLGYPINNEATENFAASTKDILQELQAEIAGLFPDIKPFVWDKKQGKYTQKMANIRKWVEAQGHVSWMETDTGALSLKAEAFERYYSYRHNYPEDCLAAQMMRYGRVKQSLNGFMPGSKRSFWDYVGSDGRVRPYMGIYVAQSARSQPAATGFIPLKSAWMRSLIQPDQGRTIVACDYAQQEFLLAGLISDDRAMVRAYHSGDPYLHTAKLAGAVPMDGLRKDYEDIRDRFKSTVLGIQYGMMYRSLSRKITADTGKFCSEEEAEALIEMFQEAYPDYQEWKRNTLEDYQDDGYLKLPCGWVMHGDNDNDRSVTNFPIQGFGSSVMRKAVSLAQDQGLDVIFTLHDALYIECDTEKTVACASALGECMAVALKHYFRDTWLAQDAVCRLDPTVWGPDWDGRTTINLGGRLGDTTPQTIYIDKRAKADYEKFSQYFTIL